MVLDFTNTTNMLVTLHLNACMQFKLHIVQTKYERWTFGQNLVVVTRTSVIDTPPRIRTSRFESLISCTPKKSRLLSVGIKVISRIASLGFSTRSWSIYVAMSMRASGCRATAGVRIPNYLFILLLSSTWFPLKKFSSTLPMPSSECFQFFFVLRIDCIYFLTRRNTNELVKDIWRNMVLENMYIRYLVRTWKNLAIINCYWSTSVYPIIKHAWIS